MLHILSPSRFVHKGTMNHKSINFTLKHNGHFYQVQQLQEQSKQPQIWGNWYQQQSSRPHSRRDLITTTTTIALSMKEFFATTINGIDYNHNYYLSKQGGIFCNHNQLNWLQPQLLSTPNKEELIVTTLNYIDYTYNYYRLHTKRNSLQLLSYQPQEWRNWLQSQLLYNPK